MATINPYGKLDEYEQERLMARRKTRRRITIIVLSSIVLVCVIVAAVVVGVSQSNDKKSGGENNQSLSTTIKSVCSATLYPDSCYNSLAPLVKSGNLKPQDLYKLSVQIALDELSKASKKFVDNGIIKKFNITNEKTILALESCQELFSLALDHLNKSMSLRDTKLSEAFDDLRTWLSSAGTYQQTCIDKLENASNFGLSTFINQNFKTSSEYTSNSLAIVSSFEESISALGAIRRRGLMSFGDGPKWLSFKDRKLLQAKRLSIKADVVVAKDGSGKFKTIGAALKFVPDKSKKRFVIYVKKGVYVENVRVEKSKWNVMMVGDGKDATIVSGRLNVVDGTPTFKSATFGGNS